MIKFKNVFIRYIRDFYSLYDFSCEINSHTLFIGDFFSGANSIMRTLAKIDKDYKGEIFIDNINIKKIKDKDLDLVYLPKNPILFKNKSIFKNLYFPLKIRKINKKTAKNLINNIFIELKNNNFDFFNNYLNNKNCDILKLKIKKLNTNEQKILTLIRAILRKPKYLLIENLFQNLDKEYIQIATYLLNKLKESSLIIACENIECSQYKNFNIIKL